MTDIEPFAESLERESKRNRHLSGKAITQSLYKRMISPYHIKPVTPLKTNTTYYILPGYLCWDHLNSFVFQTRSYISMSPTTLREAVIPGSLHWGKDNIGDKADDSSITYNSFCGQEFSYGGLRHEPLVRADVPFPLFIWGLDALYYMAGKYSWWAINGRGRNRITPLLEYQGLLPVQAQNLSLNHQRWNKVFELLSRLKTEKINEPSQANDPSRIHDPLDQ